MQETTHAVEHMEHFQESTVAKVTDDVYMVANSKTSFIEYIV